MLKLNFHYAESRTKEDINEYLLSKSKQIKISKHEIEKRGLAIVWTYKLLTLLNYINLFRYLHNYFKRQYIFRYTKYNNIELYLYNGLNKNKLDEIEIKAIDFLHFSSLVINVVFYLLIYYSISYLIKIIFFIFSSLIFLNIISNILRLHFLSKRYIPYDTKRAILLWFFNIVNINIWFSNLYMLFHNGFDKNILVSIVTPIYFSFITFATIGYGDIVPISDFLKFVVIFQIIISYMMLIVIIQDIIGAKETRSSHKSFDK